MVKKTGAKKTGKSTKTTKKKEKVVLTKGKKKSSVARARVKLVKGNGEYRVNKKLVKLIEPEMARKEMLIPVWIASDVLGDDFVKNIDIDVNVKGGGFMGQAEAVKSAVAKGIVKITGKEELKNAYLNYDRSLLVDDIRRKEPKKYMRKGARARFQKSFR